MVSEENRIIGANAQGGEGGEFAPRTFSEEDAGVSLRPTLLSEYIGQSKVKENLQLFMEAAKARGDALDQIGRAHV